MLKTNGDVGQAFCSSRTIGRVKNDTPGLEMTPLRPKFDDLYKEDGWWSLHQHEPDARYLLVACGEDPGQQYDAFVKLNEEELRDYRALGWLSLQHLAHRIRHFEDEYSSRLIRGDLLAKAQWMKMVRVERKDY